MTKDDVVVVEVARVLLDAAGQDDLAAQVRAERRAFDALAEAYFHDPERSLAGTDSGGGYLRFGIPGIEELLTPIFLAAAAEVVGYLTRRGVDVTRRIVRGTLPAPAETPELTREQWTHVREVLVTALMKHAKMSRRRAETIAAAVVGDGLTGE
ncbi:hypothetical protein GCM10010172_64720 [Paractinoplanes ferrugineus]|uniref:Uncharacterized protein n=1 Tax=Paractinoplanes ferrugineus TaxID=113564 RepID=A0A919JAA6_9ACTN|nr:hypothetical protein [Actinoplanes ferrugineus]GIE15958.1 hypothetical protein Afe05nite_77980 [Actinoplanes ferrugineus]